MECEHQFVSTRQTRFITGPGLFGTLLFLCGIPVFGANQLIGIGLVVSGILVGFIGRKKEVIVCAKCGENAPHQPT